MDLDSACTRREALKALAGGVAAALVALLGWRGRRGQPRAWRPKDGWARPPGAITRQGA